MEFILIIVGWVVVAVIWNIVVSGGKAATRTIKGQGTFGENMDLQLRGMGPFELRLTKKRAGEDGGGPIKYDAEVRGIIPVSRPTELRFVTSVLDVTTGTSQPVASIIESVQEPNSISFQFVQSAGVARPDQGFPSWTSVGMVVPDLLQTPRSGKRELRIIVRMVDDADPPEIRNGHLTTLEDARVLWIGAETVFHEMAARGWEERAEDEEEAQTLAIGIGVAVAMADGDLHDAEGAVLRRWIRRSLAFHTGARQDRLKISYNGALTGSYERAVAGELSLSELTLRMNEIGERADKYDAVELCFDVMAADGLADENELKLIRNIADAFELDFDEIERMRDQRLVELDVTLSGQASVEDILGIDPSWSDEEKGRYARSEFQKWNNRLNTLPEGDERENSQRMLDTLAEYRKNLRSGEAVRGD